MSLSAGTDLAEAGPIDAKTADEIIAYRQDHPFTTASQIGNVSPFLRDLYARTLIRNMVDVRSTYFHVRSSGDVGGPSGRSTPSACAREMSYNGASGASSNAACAHPRREDDDRFSQPFPARDPDHRRPRRGRVGRGDLPGERHRSGKPCVRPTVRRGQRIDPPRRVCGRQRRRRRRLARHPALLRGGQRGVDFANRATTRARFSSPPPSRSSTATRTPAPVTRRSRCAPLPNS